jgi:pimeloyl-ACP methyl ester carboxylesterase
MERLVAGRERVYLDRLWNEFAADPQAFPRSLAAALCATVRTPGRDACRLSAIRGLRPRRHRQPRVPRKRPAQNAGIGDRRRTSFGPTMAAIMRAAADDARKVVIQGSGHWLMEEQPAATIAAIRSFLAQPRP